MAIHVSPGAYTKEKDFSLYVPTLSSSILALVGTASKGPMNVATYLSSEGQLIDKFGPPDVRDLGSGVKTSYHQAILAAIQFFKAGNQLWFVRVGTYSAYASGTIRNSADTAASVTVRSKYQGSGYNTVTLVVSNGTTSGTYKIVVKDGSFVVETHDNLLVGTANEDDEDYIETRINYGTGSTGIGKSNYIWVTDIGAQSTLKLGTVTMSGGDDGAPADDSDVIGTVSGITRTGLKIFEDPENVDINLIAAPGRYEATVAAALLSLAESRGDCLALIDPPLGLTDVQDIVDFHNGDLTGDSDYPAAAYNSSYGTLCWSWVKFFDGYNDEQLWVPPSGCHARIMAVTDSVAAPWFSPAGMKRGRLVDALDLEYSPNQGERDLMIGGGNLVNPFVNFASDGIVLWGDKTLQRATTALQDINVRRLLLYARKIIATATRYLVFEPNDVVTWIQFVDMVNPVLRDIKNRRGLYDFRVVCDDTTNTSDLIDQGIMTAKLFLKPTRTARTIEIEFTVLPTGASFEEFT